jgi:hypothetical protein
MNVEKVWGACYTLGALYLSKNTVHTICGHNGADLTVTTEGLKWSINHLSLVSTYCTDMT